MIFGRYVSQISTSLDIHTEQLYCEVQLLQQFDVVQTELLSLCSQQAPKLHLRSGLRLSLHDEEQVHALQVRRESHKCLDEFQLDYSPLEIH